MREPIVVRCQCHPDCRLWIHVHDDDSHLLSDRGAAIVHPAHTRPDDRLQDVRPGYAITRPEKQSRMKSGTDARQQP